MSADVFNDSNLLDLSIGFGFEPNAFEVVSDNVSDRTWTITRDQKTSQVRFAGMHVFRFEPSALDAAGNHAGRDRGADDRGAELRVDSAMWSSGETNATQVEDQFARKLALAVLHAFHSNRFRDLTVHCIIKMLCARLRELQMQCSSVTERRFEDWQLSVLSEILQSGREEHFHVSQVAAKCRLSVCHFSRLFKATYSMPLHRYLVRSRIEQAKCRLAQSCDPISQIALDAGFADQSSFTRRFTAVAGMSPAIWRRRGKAAELRERDFAVGSMTHC